MTNADVSRGLGLLEDAIDLHCGKCRSRCFCSLTHTRNKISLEEPFKIMTQKMVKSWEKIINKFGENTSISPKGGE